MTTDPTPWLRLIDPILKLIPWRPKPHLVFVEQPGSWWTSDAGGMIYFNLVLQVTNDGTEPLIISRVQIRQARWKDYLSSTIDPWRDCSGVEIVLNGPELQRLFPGVVPGPSLTPRDTAVMRILHQYKAQGPELNRPIKIRLRVTDQYRRFHNTLLKVPARA